MKSRRLDYSCSRRRLAAAVAALHWAVGSNVVSAPAATIARALELCKPDILGSRRRHAVGVRAWRASSRSLAGIVLGLWLGLRASPATWRTRSSARSIRFRRSRSIPLILLIFGLGVSAKIAFGVIHGVFPIAIFTMNAVRNVAPVYHRTAHIMRLSPVTTATTIMAPAALPEILAGIRVGMALTLLGTLIGELFASTSGVGFALIRAMDVHAVTDILAITMLLFCFAASVNAILHFVERWVRHHGGYRRPDQPSRRHQGLSRSRGAYRTCTRSGRSTSTSPAASSSPWSAPPAAASRLCSICSRASRRRPPAPPTFDGKALVGAVPDGIGAVFQQDASFFWLNVWDNVAFGLRRRGAAAAEVERRVKQALPSWGSPILPRLIRRNSPAACASASASPARWCSSRGCSCSTSRSARSISRRGC